MFRDSLAAGGEEFAVVTTPGNGIELQWRTADGGTTSYTNVLGGTNVIPSWLEIIRTGNVFTAFYSTQSTTNPASVVWTQLARRSPSPCRAVPTPAWPSPRIIMPPYRPRRSRMSLNAMN